MISIRVKRLNLKLREQRNLIRQIMITTIHLKQLKRKKKFE